MSGSTESKKHKASSRKLRKQREEGSIPNAQDSSAMVSTAIGLAVSVSLAMATWTFLADFVRAAPGYLVMPFSEAREISLNSTMSAIRRAVLPIVATVIASAVLLTLVLNKGIVFAVKPVTPDLNRVSITAGFKRIFGKRGWIELFTATIRISVWLIFAVFVVWLLAPELFGDVACALKCKASIIIPIILYLIGGAIIALLLASVADIMVQRELYSGEQKMTETELKRERKDQSGSPEIRKERNRRRQQDEASAGVTLTDEQTTILFYGEKGVVGINYDPPNQRLPLISTKARTGEAADELIKKLKRLGIPVMESEAIVNNTIGKGKLDMLEVAHFREFALALAQR